MTDGENRQAGQSPSAAAAQAEVDVADLLRARRIDRSRPVLQLLIVAVLLVPVAMLIHAFFAQPNFRWPVVWDYLFSDDIMHGLVITIELTVGAMLLGVVIGTFVAVMRLSSNVVVSSLAKLYIWVFRGTPTLVQIIFWYNLGALFPTLGLGIPFGPTFLEAESNKLIQPLVAACLGLGLSQSAYTSEIIRAGILSVEPGQIEAANAMGFRRKHVLRHIILPQALPVVIPPIGNEFIGMLKYSSLASVIAVTELLGSAQLVYASNFETIPLLIVIVIWYLVLTSILTVAQSRLERWINRSRTDLRPAARKRRALFARALQQG
jgi:polar amino acid transport system permease protein